MMWTRESMIWPLATVGQLLLLCLTAPAALAGAGQRTCDQTQEGDSTLVICPMAATMDRDVIWTTRDKSTGVQTTVARCPATQDTCIDHNGDMFHAEKRPTPENGATSSSDISSPFQSTLLIKNTTREHQGVFVFCDEVAHHSTSNVESSNASSSSPSSKLQGCSIDVYAKPQRPTCVARKTGANEVNVTCWAADVFPTCHCEMTEIEDNLHHSRHIPGDTIVYKQEKHSALVALTERDGLVGASERAALQVKPEDDRLLHVCEARVQVPVKGNYVYIAIVSPKGDRLDKRAVSVPTRVTKPVTIDQSIARVYLRNGDFTQKLCAPRQTLRLNFTCEAFGFPRMPEFSWHKNGQKLHPTSAQAGQAVTTDTVLNSDGSTYMHMSTLGLAVSDNDDGNGVSCVVQDAQFAGSREFQDTRQLDIFWPPTGHPSLLAPDGSELESSVTVSLYKGLTTFECHIPGGRPSASKTEVRCHKQPVGRTLVEQKFSGPGNRLKFTVNGTVDETWACVCSGQHVTGCYRNMARFDINFSVNMKPLGSSGKELFSAPAQVAIVLSLLIVVAIILVAAKVFSGRSMKSPCIVRKQRDDSIDMKHRNHRREDGDKLFSKDGEENPGEDVEPTYHIYEKV